MATDEDIDWAQNAREAATILEAQIPGLRFERRRGDVASWGSIPMQAWGMLDDAPFYFRFRSDYASLEVYPGGQGLDERNIRAHRSVRAVLVASRSRVTGDPYAGYLGGAKAAEVFADLHARLAPPSEDNLTTSESIGRAVEALMARTERSDG
ncbi:hypothetical protein [Cellulosimicrobium sp. Marseille-Q4280]|uniref:hypothetical protein n=1 Tax=Cellulosimicrobium sp. Marseille-Q4280 TaxID=2937992 RepID=UPI00203C2861|nr:hypothetical protein [Cellulosimicrobium sp. Marseille-Q4280]